MYIHIGMYLCMYIYVCMLGLTAAASSSEKLSPDEEEAPKTEESETYAQALVCLSNREIVDASRWYTFRCKMANNRFFFYLLWPNLFSHLASFNYNGLCTPSLHVSRWVLLQWN